MADAHTPALADLDTLATPTVLDAIADGRDERNAATDTEPLTQDRRADPVSKQSGRDRYLTLSEIHQMIDAAEEGRDRMLVLLLAHTGGRIEEVVRLRACDLLGEDSAIRLTNLKRRAGQIGTKLVAVQETTVEAYRVYCERQHLSGTQYVFSGRVAGRHLSQRQARNIVYATAERAGIGRPQLRGGDLGPVWPHLFRHSLATLWIKNGVQLPVIARQLGHTQIASTLSYTYTDIRDQRKAAAQVAL